MAVEFVLGVAGIAYILVFIASILNSRNSETPAFRTFLIIFALSFLTLVPAYLFSERQNCENLLMNTTSSGNLTLYEYELTCNNPQSNISYSVYTAYLWFIRIFWIGLIILFNYYLYKGFLKPLIKQYGVK